MKIQLPSPMAQPLLRAIVDAIDRKRIRKDDPQTFLTYSEALNLIGISPVRHAGQQLLRHGLKDLNNWTMEYDELPKVAALVVNKKSRRPSSGFAESHDLLISDPKWNAWWIDQANRAIDFDWKPFLATATNGRGHREKSAELKVRDDEVHSAQDLIVPEPGERTNTCGGHLSVSDILARLAAGLSERTIVEDFPELSPDDIRAALASAAKREVALAKPSFAERWRGKFKLPEPNSGDERLNYLLKRYHRSDR